MGGYSYNNKLQSIFRGLKKHCTAAAEGKQHRRLGDCYVYKSSIYRERGKKSRVSRTAEAEEWFFWGDGKWIFRFILNESLLLYEDDRDIERSA